MGAEQNKLPQPLVDAVNKIMDPSQKLTKVTQTIATHSRLTQATMRIINTTANNHEGTITITYQVVTTKSGELANLISAPVMKTVRNWKNNQIALNAGQVS